MRDIENAIAGVTPRRAPRRKNRHCNRPTGRRVWIIALSTPRATPREGRNAIKEAQLQRSFVTSTFCMVEKKRGSAVVLSESCVFGSVIWPRSYTRQAFEGYCGNKR